MTSAVPSVFELCPGLLHSYLQKIILETVFSLTLDENTLQTNTNEKSTTCNVSKFREGLKKSMKYSFVIPISILGQMFYGQNSSFFQSSQGIQEMENGKITRLDLSTSVGKYLFLRILGGAHPGYNGELVPLCLHGAWSVAISWRRCQRLRSATIVLNVISWPCMPSILWRTQLGTYLDLMVGVKLKLWTSKVLLFLHCTCSLLATTQCDLLECCHM